MGAALAGASQDCAPLAHLLHGQRGASSISSAKRCAGDDADVMELDAGRSGCKAGPEKASWGSDAETEADVYGSASPSDSESGAADVAVATTALSPEAAVNELLDRVHAEAWPEDGFEYIRTLEVAQANFGRVDLMRSQLHGGRMMAVKRMPKQWAGEGHAEFAKKRACKELPWLDICLVRYLHERGCPFVCEHFGVFADAKSTYVVTSFADKGDLFGVIGQLGPVGAARESTARPLARQLVGVVRHLHDLGIVHGDISPENFVLHDNGGQLQVKLIDFGMASFSRWRQGSRGKFAFEAPEMHTSLPYDAFLADCFALGVVLYAVAAQDYPWSSTKPGMCRIFSYVQEHGLSQFLQRRKACSDDSRMLIEVLSPELVTLVQGLTELSPERRMCIGERCWRDEALNGQDERPSALDCAWFHVPCGTQDV